MPEFPTSSGVTEQQAADDCREMFNKAKAFEACKDATTPQNAIDNCVEDRLVSLCLSLREMLLDYF